MFSLLAFCESLGEGIEALLEAVLLQSEVLELNAVPSSPGQRMLVGC